MKIALVGYGRMGRAVDEVAGAAGHDVVARLGPQDPIHVETLRDAEVALEFTNPHSAVANVQRVSAAGADLVVGTTGWLEGLEDVTAIVREAGIGMVYAPNFALGVHLFFQIARAVGKLLVAYSDYDVYVREEHHRHKADHPSGTGRHLAEQLVELLPGKHGWAPGPSDGLPDPETLWVTSVRSGEIPGNHVIGLEGPDDRLEIRHEARGREGFARGALQAAEWVRGRVGVFTLDDMIRDRLGSPGEGRGSAGVPDGS